MGAGRDTLNLDNQAAQTPQANVSVRQLTGLQRAGVFLAVGVGLLIVIVTVIAGIDWVTGGPTPPTLPEDDLEAQAVIQNWSALLDADEARPRHMFETIVLNALLPVITLIVGYLFGAQQGSAQQ